MSLAPLRFTFVISRYGSDVLGGAERHACAVAERLAARGHSVRVLTSCATSYQTWRNELPPGTSVQGAVEVVRYPVKHGRLPGDEVLKWMSSVLPGLPRLAAAWATAQGPVVPDLLARLPLEAQERDLLVFFQLLMPPTIFGLPLVAAKSVLVPLVHRERGVHTELARRTLVLPRALLVNTTKEAEAIAEITGRHAVPVRIVGVGLEPPAAPAALTSDMPKPYVVFLGRAGKAKPLRHTWRALMATADVPPLRVSGRTVPWSDVHLVIVGGQSASWDGMKNVIQAGFVDDAARWSILRGAVALVNPSLYESLSLVLLEAWTVSRPVVVNAGCDVTADLARRSGGGIVADFSDPAGAARAIAAGLEDEGRRDEMGKRGEAFAVTTFVWERVLDEYERAAHLVATSPSG